jgi:hypothetical protein
MCLYRLNLLMPGVRATGITGSRWGTVEAPRSLGTKESTVKALRLLGTKRSTVGAPISWMRGPFSLHEFVVLLQKIAIMENYSAQTVLDIASR